MNWNSYKISSLEVRKDQSESTPKKHEIFLLESGVKTSSKFGVGGLPVFGQNFVFARERAETENGQKNIFKNRVGIFYI